MPGEFFWWKKKLFTKFFKSYFITAHTHLIHFPFGLCNYVVINVLPGAYKSRWYVGLLRHIIMSYVRACLWSNYAVYRSLIASSHIGTTGDKYFLWWLVWFWLLLKQLPIFDDFIDGWNLINHQQDMPFDVLITFILAAYIQCMHIIHGCKIKIWGIAINFLTT